MASRPFNCPTPLHRPSLLHNDPLKDPQALGAQASDCCDPLNADSKVYRESVMQLISLLRYFTPNEQSVISSIRLRE